LQHNATHCNTRQQDPETCKELTPGKPSPQEGLPGVKLQHTATHCNALQCTATHCNALQRTAMHCNTLQHTTKHYNTLQNTPQHTATHCNTLQQDPETSEEPSLPQKGFPGVENVAEFVDVYEGEQVIRKYLKIGNCSTL